jgi:hypothetical protein
MEISYCGDCRFTLRKTSANLRMHLDTRYIGIVVDRTLLAPNVAPANEAPNKVLIYNHNESPQVPHTPEYIFFYCHRAPEQGGETPISSSIELFARAEQEILEFIDLLAEKGIQGKVIYQVDKQHTAAPHSNRVLARKFSMATMLPRERAKSKTKSADTTAANT